jgi:hypothetical protein
MFVRLHPLTPLPTSPHSTLPPDSWYLPNSPFAGPEDGSTAFEQFQSRGRCVQCATGIQTPRECSFASSTTYLCLFHYVLTPTPYLPPLLFRNRIPGASFWDHDIIADTSSGLPHMLPTDEIMTETALQYGIRKGETVRPSYLVLVLPHERVVNVSFCLSTIGSNLFNRSNAGITPYCYDVITPRRNEVIRRWWRTTRTESSPLHGCGA